MQQRHADNVVDLVTQGSGCATAPEGYEGEAFSSDVELCPTYDYATCGDEFVLYLELALAQSGQGAVSVRSGPPRLADVPLPTVPVAFLRAIEPLPHPLSTPRMEPLKLCLEPLRHEPAPPVPLVAPGEH